jgi:hypothetical protein
MTDLYMFEETDLQDKIKLLKKKLRMSKNISNDLEVIIESQKKEIDTLKQIIGLQELQSQTTEKKMKSRTDKIFQLKSILMKCREKGKFELAMKLMDKYKIDKETLEEKYYD